MGKEDYRGIEPAHLQTPSGPVPPRYVRTRSQSNIRTMPCCLFQPTSRSARSVRETMTRGARG